MLALVPLGTGAGAEPESTFVAGSGRARASLFEIVPRTGGLEIPINFGKALVTYQGLSATATSGGVKPPSQEAADGECGGAQPPGGGGGGGGGAPAPPKLGGDNPTAFPFVSTLTVSTGDENADKGREIDQGRFPDGSPITGRFEHQAVRANADPYGWAATTSGQVAFSPLIEVVNGRTEAETGIKDRKARIAHAVTTMDRLNLFGGLVSLIDVRWEATQRTGDEPRADGTFAVGSVLFQGKPLPAPPAPPAPPAGFPGGGSAPPLPDPLAVLNTALGPTGLAVESPRLDTAGGVARVTPMTVRIADSALGSVVLAPLVTSLQPLRETAVGGLLALSCDFGAAVTVGDVASGVVTGTGGIRFDFGGVSATTEGEVYDNPFAGGIGEGAEGGDGGFGSGVEVPGLPDIPSADAIPSTAFSTPAGESGAFTGDSSGGMGGAFGGSSSSGGSQAAGADSEPPAGADPAGDEVAYADPAALFGPMTRHEPGNKGGRALAVAALAILTVAALAAADAMHLRRASRSIS
ncbi:MAG TPA: hypothetical protein VEG38_07625 [Acidimicrobiia bacterium]|nr:hypothetical protein [Acidimicrobiia bacterium]